MNYVTNSKCLRLMLSDKIRDVSIYCKKTD